MEQDEKYRQLLHCLAPLTNTAVAFSGGVDSTFLLAAAAQALGHNQVLAVTAVSAFFPADDLQTCRDLTSALNIRHQLVEVPVLDVPEVRSNSLERCYYCKGFFYRRLQRVTTELGLTCLLDGTNLDDLDDHRPGFRAVRELNLRSPLLEVGLTKAQIRNLSRQLELPTWNHQSSTCLATRFPFATELSRSDLQRVDACEHWLRQKGLSLFRLRCHGSLARIEVDAREMAEVLVNPLRKELVTVCKKNGFDYVTLDLQGYRRGSMNHAPAG